LFEENSWLSTAYLSVSGSDVVETVTFETETWLKFRDETETDLLLRFQCQHSTLSSSAYSTLQTDTDKFEKLQLRFRFMIASALPVFWPLAKSQPVFGSRPILWA